MLIAFVWRTKEHDIYYFRNHLKELDTIRMNDEEFSSTIGEITKFGYTFTDNWLEDIRVVIINGLPNHTIGQFFYELEARHLYDNLGPDYGSEDCEGQESLPEYFTLSDEEDLEDLDFFLDDEPLFDPETSFC